MARALVLVDGEHYPPVILDALGHLEERGYQVVAAVMLGGAEKLRGALDLGGIEIVHDASQREALTRAIEGFAPEVVLDLSDAPVVDTRSRMLLASIALAHGVAYQGADFRFEPPPRPRLTDVPTIAVIGTGKRTGKTAVAAALARALREAGRSVVIVAMGRGGPATPVVIRGQDRRPGPEALLELARRGEHAASDSYEDAVIAGVTTVGARRAGAGLAGAPFSHTVHPAVRVAEAENPDVIVLEGSGTAIPPVHADATVLVVGGATPWAEVAWGMGPYRVLIADLAVVTMAEEPVLSSETLSALTSSISELAVDVPIVRTVFRPAPVGDVAGMKTFVATTAPESAGPALRKHLEEVHGASVVGITHRLADRPTLTQELAQAEGTYEVLLTELKAAAVDVATATALESGARVVYFDNVPVAIDGADLAEVFGDLDRLAAQRAAAHR